MPGWKDITMGPGGYFVRFTACYEYREVARVFRQRFMPQAVLVREQEPLASRVERHLHSLQIQICLYFVFYFLSTVSSLLRGFFLVLV